MPTLFKGREIASVTLRFVTDEGKPDEGVIEEKLSLWRGDDGWALVREDSGVSSVLVARTPSQLRAAALAHDSTCEDTLSLAMSVCGGVS